MKNNKKTPKNSTYNQLLAIIKVADAMGKRDAARWLKNALQQLVSTKLDSGRNLQFAAQRDLIIETHRY